MSNPEETAPKVENPSPGSSPSVAGQVVGPTNGDSETAIALDERRRLLRFLEEMHHEQADERRQWFALIERLSGARQAQQWWPPRVWHWLIADAPMPGTTRSAAPVTRQSQRAPRNGDSGDGPEAF